MKFLGGDIFQEDEELYIPLKGWQAAGMYKAKQISRHYHSLNNVDSMTSIGLLTRDDLVKYNSDNGRKNPTLLPYPDIKAVIPAPGYMSLEFISLDINLLQMVCKIVGDPLCKIKFTKAYDGNALRLIFIGSDCLCIFMQNIIY